MTDHLTAVIICALAVALAIGCYARERDADREAARALALVESCANAWEQQIDATLQCLTVLDDVRASDVACACWEAP